MKVLRFVFGIFLLVSCSRPDIEEVDLSSYFKGIGGSAVFYNPASGQYKAYNAERSGQRSSPCSTFKIMSSYLALSENLLTAEQSKIKWNQKRYDMPAWNRDMDLDTAFKTSCVWYFRALIDRISPAKVQAVLDRFRYGNRDISDWSGALNTNTDDPQLKGFWIESSLQISPLEQVRVLAELFAYPSPVTETLKKLMLTTVSPVKVYGKTGLGIKDNLVDTAWFVGFYETKGQTVYFAVRLDDAANPLADYRHQASRYARQIALDIIADAELF